MSLTLMKGSEAVAEAAIRAGARFFFGYPITPQTEIPEYMSARLPEVGGCFLQAESEVAAINMVYGAAATGERVITSSSSPGVSLKQEGISYMAGARLPAVILNVMRGGPGLGSIQASQGDYLDGIMCQMMEPVEMPEMVDFKVEPEKKPWAVTGWKPGDDPAKRAVINSLFITTEELSVHNAVLQATYREIEKNEKMWECYKTEDADYIITAFGTVARIAKSATDQLRAEGIKVGLFRPITVWPFPYDELREATKGCKAILDVEANEGQMKEDVLLAVAGTKEVQYFGHCGSQMPTTDEIVKKIHEMKEGR